MGLFDKAKGLVKDAAFHAGVFLSAKEEYSRAYQKGVFLQPPNYESAIKDFASAAEKFAKENNNEMVARAKANAALYTLVLRGDKGQIAATMSALGALSEIERVGSQQEMVPTAPLISELTALSVEIAAGNNATNDGKAAAYKQAADVLLPLGGTEPQFVKRLGFEGPTDKAVNRAYYYMAMSDYYLALSVLHETPEQTQDYLQRSENLFKQAQVNDWAMKTHALVDDVRLSRHCWMCDREVQGRNIYYKHYPAQTTKYFGHIVEKLKQDQNMLEERGTVTLCTACGTAIEAQADEYAKKRVQELREWVTPILEQHAETLSAHERKLEKLSDRIDSLSRSLASK